MTLTEVGLFTGQGITFIGLVVTLLTVLFNKKARTPADDQARIAFGVAILEKQLERAQEREQQWTEVEKFLRGQLDKQEGENTTLKNLVSDVQRQVRELEIERDELQRRIRHLAAMHTRGEAITLEDILGATTDTASLAVA